LAEKCDVDSADSTEIIEEAPAPGLSAELKRDLAEKAVAAAKAVN
jgi:3-methylcrotonyl-CoA carboxylase alpha subunit